MEQRLNRVCEFNSSMDDMELWEGIKLEVYGFSSKYTAKKVKKKCEKLNHLTKELQDLFNEQCLSMQDNMDRICNIKQQIEVIYVDRVRSSIFRSKARWYAEGERSSKYFFRLEKQRSNHKTMTVLVKEDGSMSRNQKEILKLQANFYERLYTTEPEISFCFVNNSDCKLMPEEEKETNKELELEELTIVLK